MAKRKLSPEEKTVRSAERLVEKCEGRPNEVIFITVGSVVDIQKVINMATSRGIDAEVCCSSTRTISGYLDNFKKGKEK
ncbi:MAG: hypothetical protein ABIA11_02645 [Patescibacteria group bacterium]|nr:hypothetical protein [Patescibacteria group bacterium]